MNIKFNKWCLKNKLIPKYATIKIKKKSITATKVKKQAELLWLKNEISHLYKKKAENNKMLLKSHLKMLNEIDKIYLHNIQDYINDCIKNSTNKILKKHNNKKKALLNHRNNKVKQIECKHKFHQRVMNLTDMNFNTEEIKVLEKGLKYNLPNFNNKTMIIDEVTNAEAVIKSIKNNDIRNEARILINNKLNKRLNNNTKIGKLKRFYSEDTKIINSLKNKIRIDKSIVVKADKGNTIVIMKNDQYIQKSYDFINNNGIIKINIDPTQNYKTEINEAINNSTNLLDDITKRMVKQINPQAPQFNGLPKIHKQNTPIRPLINFKTSPGYKIAKKIAIIIKNNIILDNNHSIKNNFDFIEKTKNIDIKNNFKLASFDIVNMYTSIPIDETISILKNNLIKHKKLN